MLVYACRVYTVYIYACVRVYEYDYLTSNCLIYVLIEYLYAP